MDKRILALLPLLLVAAPALFFHAFSTDEYTYMNTARSFSQGEFFKVEDASRFPLFSVSLAIPFLLFGASEVIAKIVALLFGLAAVLAVYEVGKRAYGEEKGFWAALSFSSVPFFAFLSTRVLSESLFLLLFVSCVLVLREVAVEERKDKLPLLGVLFALLFLSRYNGLALALVVPLVFWRTGKLNFKYLLSKEHFLGKLAFLLTLSPWLYYSYLATGSPIGLAYNFTRQQVHVGQQLFMTLPDRIPTIGGLASIPGSAALASILVLGFPLLLGLYRLFSSKSKIAFLKERVFSREGFVFFSALLATALAGEAVGLLHPSLVRYAVPAAPFVALLVVSQVEAGNSSKGKPNKAGSQAQAMVFGVEWKKALLALVVLNMLAGLLLVSLFTPYAPVKLTSYEKQSLHRQVALLASNCTTIASNMRNPILFYTGKNHTEISLQPDCIALSDFEGGYIGEVPASYQSVFSQSGARLYRKVS